MLSSRLVCAAAVVLAILATPAAAQTRTPEQFFGFKPGTSGELATYPKVVEYLRHLAQTTDRVKFEVVGKTTMNNDYVLAVISSRENLGKLDRLTQITRRLADPRGLTEQEARGLIAEGRPFYFLYTTIHATEVGNMQASAIIAHTLATDPSPAIREVLENAVVLLVPSQNPDGQVMVIDHWYKTKGTHLNRVFPDLYHKYVGHDNNRDWFMFTQKETRLAVQIQNRFKPQITHDMHQQGTSGSRIFVPPFQDPYDPNIHPILAMGQATVGQAMATALIAEGKAGVAWNEQYDLWTPARQYMVYHGQPRILTEIASASLADPFVNPAGKEVPLGPQDARMNFPKPYSQAVWTLGQIVDYGVTAALAGITHVAKYRQLWLENFYKVQRDSVNWSGTPHAFVIPPSQRDPMATRELLEILHAGEVELQRATTAFNAGGGSYPAGSIVVKVAQPFGPFAKTLLERQQYPDLRLFPGGPPKPPYDVTGHTLGFLMGVEVQPIAERFDAALERFDLTAAAPPPFPQRPKYSYLIGPESNAGFKALVALQKANVAVYRAAARFESGGREFAAGTWIVPPDPTAAKALEAVSKETGLQVFAADRAPAVGGFRIKPGTRVGLYRGANNMPGGWLMWLFEQYGFNHQIVTTQDVLGDLAAKYDVIVMPAGLTRDRIVSGLDPAKHDGSWAWAYGVGEAGWKKLEAFVRNGGTIVAIGNATETVRELFDLPIEKALPEGTPRRFAAQRQGAGAESRQVSAADAERQLKDAFTSPARLMQTLRDRVADPQSLFYCPGSLLQNEFDPNHPVAFGMPAVWPVFFESDQAYRLRPGFEIDAQIVSRYPREQILQSGWLLGEEYLRDQANAIAFTVGRGTVVTFGSQIDYRTQPRATLKLLFNAMFHGPSTRVTAAELERINSQHPTPNPQAAGR